MWRALGGTGNVQLRNFPREKFLTKNGDPDKNPRNELAFEVM